ncbi:PAS domain S-box protein [Christiangramia sabulilitoris]|uniref:histidine kinase n=1 Tax=Christiangramia sabulilitoris TaxID=2583991 RepID=A0A550HXM4_9FLAO|nr:PAS domain S-box protein [Christiangramia sabulilitoris]TRO63278.1 PAS domain S-box protein [Christiangramia sabulilitoris]
MNYVKDRLFPVLRENACVFEFTQVNAQDGFLIIDICDPSKIWLNPKLRTVLGYENTDLQRVELTTEFLEDETISLLSEIENGKYQVHLKHKQGFKLYLNSQVLKVDYFDSSLVIFGFNQIEPLPEVKINLLRKINRYKKIIEGTELGTWQWNIQTGEVIFSEKWAEILGYELKELEPTSEETWASIGHPDDQEKCKKGLQEHFEGVTEYYQTDARVKHKSGHWIWVRDKGKVVSWTKDGEPEWMTGFHADITEEKKSLEIKMLFIDQAPTAIAMLDTEMNYIAASQNWRTDYQLEDDVIGKNHYQLFPNISEEWKEIHRKCLRGEVHRKDEDCFYREDGTEQWISWEVRPWYTQESKIGGLVMHTADITRMKMAEKENFQKQQLMETVLENIDVGIVACDKDGNLSLFNKATKDWHGLPAKPIPQDQLSEYYGLYNVDGTRSLETDEIPLLKVLKTGKLSNEEIMIKPKKGDSMKVSVNGSRFYDESGNIAGAVVAMHNITHRIDAEEKLRISEETFRGSFEHAAIGMAVLNAEGKWLQMNNRVCEIVGYSADELKKLTFHDITHPEDLNLDLTLLNELVEGKREYYHMDKRYYHKQGHIVYINLAVSLVRDEKKNPLFFVSQITDITKQKTAEARFEQTLAEMKALLEASTQVSIISIRPDGIITAFNKGAENLLGYSKDEVIGIHTPALIHSKKQVKARAKEFEKKYGESHEGVELFKAMARKNPYDTREWFYKRKNGTLFPVQLTITAIKEGNEIVGYLGVATDITAIKSVQRDLTNILKLTDDQNDRLKNFAHIVSHNLRSHSGNLGMLLDLYIEDHPDQKNNQIIEMLYNASGNLKESIEHLNEVTVINTNEGDSSIPIALHEEINNAVESVNALIGDADLEVINEVPEDCYVLGIKAYIESVLLNFTTNGIKYLSKDRDSYLKFSVENKKKFTHLIIEDNGLGIDLDRHRQKLFGMYKTFHNHKDSRGIGLFITKNQVEAMGGKINVESTVDKGTKFIISLKKYEKS